eukprot:12034896-Ditylum_brightwellii.AAC.1
MDPNTGVATIRGTNHCPQGKCVAKISWKDDDGMVHEYRLNNAFYFPDSLVNVISLTSLVDQLNDNEGPYVTTKQTYSIFSWDQEKAKLTIDHSPHS